MAALTGCLQVNGEFDGVRFSPSSTRFAVADRHQLAFSGGTLIATQRPDAAKTLTLLFTAAWANPDTEWRRSGNNTLLTLRQDLAATDGLLLTEIPLSTVIAGAELQRHEGTGEIDQPRDFSASVVVGGDQVIANPQQGFGSALEFTLTIEAADARAHGTVQGRLEFKRSRGQDQEGEVATGEISFDFNLAIVAERRGKANLALAAPIMECAHRLGPARSAACASEPPRAVPEAADGVAGFNPAD